ncbi:sialic acid-binding adhesin [Streptococcus oralis]
MKKEIINKNLKKQDKEKVMRFSIRKYSFGAASVAVATLLMFLGNGAVSADQLKISEESANKVELMQDGEKISTDQSNAKDSQPELDKSLLANYILEIETNITSGVYSIKTEESLANLSTELASAKASLNSALNQEELNRAYQKLVTAVNSKLRNKVVEKKEISEDTTNRQDTVTQKTENVEKETENSEKNTEPIQDDKTESTVLRKSSSVDSNTGFRAAVNEDPKVDFTFSIPSEKKIYIYNEENFTLEIPVYSESGKIRYATIKKGSRQKFNNVPDTENDLDIEYGFTATVINRAENPTLTTPATKKNPAKIVIKGRPNDVLKNNSGYTKREDQNLNIGTRYLQVVDDKGRENLKKGQDMSDPAYFYLVLKSQSKKYALRAQPADELITVSSLTNPTAEDREKIKNGIQIEYSTANEDARLVNKRGTLVENPDEIIQSIDVVGNNIVVTFTDGSTRTRPVGEVLRENIPPTVQVPYSNEQNRTIYVYSSEETDLTFTAKDESKIKDMKLRGAGDSTEGNLDAFGYTVGKITESALTSGEGSVSDDKKSASIKMTGITNAKPGQKWTSIIVANDYNNGESASYNGRIEETINVAERQKTAGYVEFVVKNQTSKYDIQAPESKVSVVDPNNITTEEFEKIKEKVKIEYSQTNDDANLISKSGKIVENQEARIDTIAKDLNGNLVVTYKDGSIDTRFLSEFITLNKQPAIDAINDAAESKIVEINSNLLATAEEKAEAIAKVNADKEKALTAIGDVNITTKEALDFAKGEGLLAISKDNPITIKKDAAKAAIDDALKAKEAEINSRIDLTDEEKAAAKADAKAKADEAKKNIDVATTNATVESAKTSGIIDIESVNPQAGQKKNEAKTSIEQALKAKEAEIDSRTDLTDEEKAIAKADAKAKADEAKKNIDAATTNAEVDQAKSTGTTEVNGVNPTAQSKPVAKQAIDEALKVKEAAIDSRTDLTDEEKAIAKADAKAKADEAKKNIDTATTDEAVSQAKTAGTTSIASVSPTAQSKPAAKQAIDEALKAKEAAIDSRTDLTDEEKAVARADAKAKADEAKKNIDNATTDEAVSQAKTAGTTSIASVNPTAQSKPVAKQSIDDALKAKETEIDSRTDLTDEEKAAAKADAQAKADEAKKNIDAATTDEAVSQAKTAGTTEVNGVNPAAQSKPAAKQAIDDALKAKEAAIDSRTDLTDEEKAVAKADAKAKADEAKKNIDATTTDAEVDQAKSTGTTEVNAVNPAAQSKPAAKQAIDDALKAKESAIDSRTDLTDEEKAAAKADAKAKADEAKKNIDVATTNSEVDQAKTDGTTEVNGVEPTAQSKPAAKQAIDDALKAKESAIDSRTDLTDEEKAAAKADAKAKADEAKKNIDAATTNAEVDQAKSTGTTEVNGVNPTAQSKPAAKQSIDDDLKAKEAAIDSRTDLTDEEKAVAKADAKAKADTAKQAIDTATTNSEVDQAKNDGTTEVNSVNPTAQSKPAAKQAIDDALKTKESAIDSRTDLTDEEKAAAKADAKAKSDEAKKNIDAATTNAEVDQVKTDGITEVNGVNPQPVAKPVAKQAIEEALKAKEAAIDSRTDLTDEEKAAAKADAQAKADEAKKNIDAATTNAEVDQAKSTGTTEVNAVNPQAVAKPAAKQAIDDALKTKEAAIDSRTDLTDEEKAVAKADAKAKADTAKQAIDTATTNSEVDQAKNDGTTEVNSVNPTAQSKPAAKQAIEEALKAKEAAIDSRTDLTDEEKAAAKADAQAKADEAKKNIDAATTNAEVDQAKSTGTTEVNAVNPQAVAKPAAKQAIDDALKTKEAAIDSRTDLTDEEKAAAKADAQAKADEAKKNIDAATTNAEVDQAKSTGTTEVNAVNPQAVSKPAAKQAIDDALKTKEAAIDSRTDLTDEEKAAAKADAKAKADEAKKNIDAATTDEAVSQAKTAGTTEVNSVNPTAQSKPAAKQAIDDALKAKEAAIDSRTDLTDEEKAIAKADAQAKADEAKKNIDAATTNAEVDQAKSTGTTEVNAVNPQAVAKPAAKQAIDDALKTKEAAIDSRTDLTDEEKAAAKADAQAKADEAKKNIDAATTNAEVDQAKSTGTTEVNAVNPQAVSKPAAKQAIDDALKTKEAAIDSRTDLTDEEKAAAKADAKAKADEAKKNIDAATTDEAVSQAKTAGTTEVNSVNPTAQSKPAAKQAIDDALKAKEAAIDSRTDLTDEEKAIAKADAKAKADTAKQAIDNATTNSEVDQAKNDGTTEVNSVNPTAQSKPAAKQAIEDALKAKEAAIDSRTDLTDEEKAIAKADAKAKADEAKKNIDTATTDEAVSQAKTDGITEVNGVELTAQSKPAAKQAIDEALKAKEAAIDSRTDLTDEEKAVAKADAKAKADEAKKNIDAATTDEAVSQAKTAGTTEVNGVNPTAQSKPAAKQAIDDALKAKESAIDSRTDLTDEEKTAAKADAKAKADTAKQAIDAATTDEAVSQAKTAGTTEVNGVNPTAQSKPSAKQAIDDALKAKEAAIDSRTDLTDEEKAAAKADAKAKADEAKKNIDAATTDEAVSKAKTAGTTEITSINPQAVAKPAAKQAIDDALKAKEVAIDSRTDLTDEEKAVAKADAKAKAEEAKKNIDAATTDEAVSQAKTAGTTEVNGVNPAAQSKPAAKQAIDDALKAKETEIDSRTDLTDEEKAAAKADAKVKAEEAKRNIDTATTDEAVSQAKTAGTTEVNAVNPTAQSKPTAKQAIDDALKAKETEIDSRTDLTDEEKTAAKADAKAKADEAKRNIDAATTNAEVDQVKTDGITEVNGVNPQPVAKPVAKQAIEEALKAKEAEIDSRTDLTDEEKAAAKADAQAKSDETKKNIDAATTNAEVDQAKSTGTTEVNAVNPQAVAKPAAKQAIDDALKTKEAAIDSRTDLTDEEKAAAKADAQAKADEAKKNIDAATTNAEVDQAKSTGTTEVNAVNPQAVAKPAAKQAIDDALKTKEAAIDSRTDLTDEEKAAAKADANAKADEAKKNIDTATTDEAVSQAKTAGTTEVNSVNPQAVSKPAAKQAIDDALKAKEAAIDSRTDLTDEEKAVAKADAKAKSDEAKKNIDAATTNAEVDQAKSTGTTEVNSVNPQPVAKPAAKQAIDDALKTKEAAIDSRTDLTDEEKAVAKADAKAKADEAKKNIDAATTDEAVSQAKTAGTTEVNGVNPTAQSKPAAKQAIDDALKAKESAIDSRTDLTDEEKAAAKADANAKADTAKQAIDAATTNVEVDQAKTDGITSIASVNPTAQSKPEAKKAVEDTLKTKKLPNTGTAESLSTMVVAATSAILGLALLSHRRKEDDEV